MDRYNVCMQTREIQKKKVEQHVGTANKTYGGTEWEERGAVVFMASA